MNRLVYTSSVGGRWQMPTTRACSVQLHKVDDGALVQRKEVIVIPLAQLRRFGTHLIPATLDHVRCADPRLGANVEDAGQARVVASRDQHAAVDQPGDACGRSS